MTDIRVYVHAMDVLKGPDILKEQVDLLEKTGLLDAAREVNMICHFHETSFNWLKERWKDRTNVLFHNYNDNFIDWYEATTMQSIQNAVHGSTDEFYVLCMTAKGMSHSAEGHHNWRKYMQYWTVDKWKECVEKLDEGYELVGSPWLDNPPYPFMAGTFFWAKASYLRRCRKLLSPAANDFKPQFEGQPHHRFDLECWPGSGNPKAYDMNPGEDNRWYGAPSTYRKDMENIIIYNTES